MILLPLALMPTRFTDFLLRSMTGLTARNLRRTPDKSSEKHSNIPRLKPKPTYEEDGYDCSHQEPGSHNADLGSLHRRCDQLVPSYSNGQGDVD